MLRNYLSAALRKTCICYRLFCPHNVNVHKFNDYDKVKMAIKSYSYKLLLAIVAESQTSDSVD